MASDYNTLERLLEEGIPEQHTGVMLNWVDTKKFALRKRWSEKPKKALVFSNYATRDNHLGIIQQACDLAGLELDCIGRGVGNAVDKPENFLGSYDIVFAKAKAAIEALATGAMVIPCDFRGLGETVVSANFAHLRKYNFGMKILNRPITTELLIEEIHKYEPKDIKRVADLIRKHSAFRPYVDQLLTLYKKTIRQYRYGKRIYDRDGRIAPELRLSKSIRWLRRI